jgi:acyl-CoA thioester hydrolase
MSRRYKTEVAVHWGDVDLAGVVYFPHFFRYFSIAETEFYRSNGLSMVELEESLNIRLPRVDARCRYLMPARFGDRLSIVMEIEHIGTKTVKYLFEVRRGNDMIAQGHLVIVAVSIADFKAIPLPSGLREFLRPYAPSDGAAQSSS